MSARTGSPEIHRGDGWVGVGDVVVSLADADDTVVVVGLGSLGRNLAAALAGAGQQVLGLDRDDSRAAELSHRLPVRVVDATDLEALVGAGVAGCAAAVVCMSGAFGASVLATGHLSDLGVSTVWAAARTAEQARVLRRVGAHRVLDPYREAAAAYATALATAQDPGWRARSRQA